MKKNTIPKGWHITQSHPYEFTKQVYFKAFTQYNGKPCNVFIVNCKELGYMYTIDTFNYDMNSDGCISGGGFMLYKNMTFAQAVNIVDRYVPYYIGLRKTKINGVKSKRMLIDRLIKKVIWSDFPNLSRLPSAPLYVSIGENNLIQCNNFGDCVRVIDDIRNLDGLGSEDYYTRRMGKVYKLVNGIPTIIAEVSYNGRVWESDGTFQMKRPEITDLSISNL